MAFSISSSISFSPQALSRPTKSKNTRPNKSKPKTLNPQPNPKLRPLPPISSISGGDATTYTRLPPRDDTFISPLTATEIKLSDLTLPKPATQTLNQKRYPKFSTKKLPSGKIDGENDENEFDYGKFELFEAEANDDYGITDEETGEIEEVEVKEKGVPAAMRCFDRAKIFTKGGDGGDGVMAFRREKYVPLGGPSGGDGGRGGNVYLEVDSSMNSLLPFRQSIHFRAGRGSHGQGRNMHGAKGEDVVVKVPPGTVVRDGDSGEVLLELLRAGEKALVLPGGRGGRGNASFKSGLNKVPKIAEDGEEGPEL